MTFPRLLALWVAFTLFVAGCTVHISPSMPLDSSKASATGQQATSQQVLSVFVITDPVSMTDAPLLSQILPVAKQLQIEVVFLTTLYNSQNIEKASIIYLTPSSFMAIEAQLLQQWYASGKTIVAINTPSSRLGQKLHIAPNLADLKMEYLPRGYIAASVYKSRNHEPAQLSGQFVMTDFFQVSLF